jgi:hypothetical protein
LAPVSPTPPAALDPSPAAKAGASGTANPSAHAKIHGFIKIAFLPDAAIGRGDTD